ncbi:tetratricopeptide repeat protein [Bremerella cremea]|uniref:tetratricopeptide repeat protein n=1 Tax=Bremerella cremea TaxID=1031537 RepID=UPI0031EC9EF4
MLKTTLVQTGLACCILLAWAAPSSAQDVKTLVAQAAELSESAQSQDELTQVIQVCDEAKQLEMTQAQVDYFIQLEAWARNKRGEIYAETSLMTDDEDKIRMLEAAALQDFSAAIKLNPKHWQAIHNRAVSYAMIGENGKALADLDSALSLNPKFELALYNKAELLYEAGQFPAALKNYQAVLKINPKDIGAMTGQAHCFYRLENFEAALTAYNQAVKLEPENALVLANRADAYSDLGLWKQAILDYKKALTFEKDLPRAQQGLAWILATCPEDGYRNPELALRFAQAAVAQNDLADFRYYDTLAAAEAAMGQFDVAKQRMSEAMKGAPQSEKPFLQHRLALYESRQPYREPKR